MDSKQSKNAKSTAMPVSRRSAVGLGVGLGLAAVGLGDGIAAAAKRLATFTPIPITPQSQPFRGTNETAIPAGQYLLPELKPAGYVEEEYFLSGSVDGKPYRTTVLVRKPADPKKFSGLVFVEPLHVAGTVAIWGAYKRAVIEGGHAWAVVAVQKAPADDIVRKANPARYASISIPQISPPPANPLQIVVSGDAQDRFAQAIMTQFGALLRSNPKSGPFAGQAVKHVVMGGGSQTGLWTLRYIEQANPGARRPNGKPIWDAFNITITPYNRPVRGGDSLVMHAYGEGDILMFEDLPGGGKHLVGPDSDGPKNAYRAYELTGGSHIATRGQKAAPPMFGAGPAAAALGGPGRSPSQLPIGQIYAALFDDLILWVTKGVAPPRTRRIETANGAIVRDEFGNAKGGVRSPYLDMPAYRYIADPAIEFIPPGPGRIEPANLMLSAMAVQLALPADSVKARLKSRENYLTFFNQGIDKMVADRLLRPADAAKIKAEEAASPPL